MDLTPEPKKNDEVVGYLSFDPKGALDAEDGAVKVGFAAVVLDSVTAGPPVWVHA